MRIQKGGTGREKERKGNEKQRAEEWKKMNRFDKIRLIREKMEENKTVAMSIKPATLPEPVKRDQAEQHCISPTKLVPSGQAEQPNHEASGDRAEEPEHDSHGQDQAEQEGQGSIRTDLTGSKEDPGEQTSSSTPLTIRQPLTIPRAVARCVSIHDKYHNLQSLTSDQLGKAPKATDQADQPGDHGGSLGDSRVEPEHSQEIEKSRPSQERCSQLDSQAEPQHSQNVVEKSRNSPEGCNLGDSRAEPQHSLNVEKSRNSPDHAETVRQPLTIPRAVARCVSFHEISIIVPTLISSIPKDTG